MSQHQYMVTRMGRVVLHAKNASYTNFFSSVGKGSLALGYESTACT